MTPIRLDALAKALDARLEGDPALVVSRPDTLAEAGEGSLSFLANRKYAEQVAHTRATAVLVTDDYTGPAPCALLRTPVPDLAFARATRLLVPPPPQPAPGVHPSAVVAPDAVLGEGCRVGALAVVEPGARLGAGTVVYPQAYIGHGVTVGENCVIYPHVALYYGVRVGNRAILHAGAVVGSDGFGFVWNGAMLEKAPQVGVVEIADDVEIGANTTIDRARFGATRIGPGTKIDNLVQIAHNVRVGAHCGFAAQVGIAGSTEIGNGVKMGGQAGVGGHLHVGDQATILAQSGLSKDVPANTTMFGYPAQEQRAYLEEHRHFKALSALRRTVKALVKKVGLTEDERK